MSASGRRPEYPALGTDGLTAVLKAIQEATKLPSKPSSEQVLAQYSELFERAFSHLSVLVGSKGAEAITQRAIKRASVRLPGLSAAAVSEAKVALEPLLGGSSNPKDLQEAIEHLFVMTMDVLASLIGVELLTTLLKQLTSGGATGDRH